MNHAVQQVAADIAATAARTSKTQREQATNDDRFMNMLSDAMHAKPNESVKQPEQTEKPTGMTTDSKQAAAQAKPDEEAAALDLEDSATYEQQAVAAAMQMQITVPILTEIPQTEVTDEIIAAENPTEIQPVQTAQAQATGAETLQPETTGAATAQTAPAQATAEQPQTTPAAETAETAAQTKPVETTAPRTARTNEPAPDTTTRQAEPQMQTDNAQRQTIRQRPDRATASTAAETTAENDGEGEVQTARQPEAPRPLNQIRGHRDPETAQSKFDGMLARASQELNRSTAVQTAQPTEEVPEEAPTAEPVTAETKPQEQAKQPEPPKTEIKPQEEAKPAEHTAAQKSVKAPVTEQRPQQEISKADEAVLGMAQTKQPEILHEVLRSEPAPVQTQPVQVPDQAEQIKAQVIKNLENERTEFRMQLQPEELGKVNVKMILEGGKLSVEIAALNPKSTEMLARQVESLVASLKASGADVSSVNVVTANENASAQMDGEYNLNNFQNRGQGQGQGGRSHGTGTAGGQGENTAQAEREPADAPQRILNYSV